MSPTAWRLAFIAGFALQCVVLYWPSPPGVGTEIPLDKAVHFAIFAAVAALGVRAGLSRLLVGALLALQAIASEALQSLVIPGRGGDLGDLLADVVGIAVGLLIGWRWLLRAGPAAATAQPQPGR